MLEPMCPRAGGEKTPVPFHVKKTHKKHKKRDTVFFSLNYYIKVMTPVLTDRHGFLLYKGNTVEKIADNSRFVISEVVAIGTSPVVHLLKDGSGGVVDASLVMLTDQELDRNSWKRATFCQVCFNHYEEGVTWFKTPFDHPKRNSVSSACEACVVNVDQSTLPEVSWAV